MVLTAVVVGLSGAAPAFALQLATVRISGPTPFQDGCGAAGNGMYTRNSAVEPDIEVDPRNQAHVIAAWIQDDGSAIATSASTDGGGTWTRTVAPGLTQCTGGRESATGDPWLSFGSDRRLYLAAGSGSITPDPAAPGGFRIVTEQFVNRSTDTGASWSQPAVTEPLTGARYDKQTVTADPLSGRAYAVFCQRPSPGAAHQAGALYVSKTVDGGGHWSDRQLVYRSPISGEVPFNNGGVVLQGHTVVLAFELQNPDTGPSLRVMTIRSTNYGRTWGRAIQLGVVPTLVAGTNGPEPPSTPTHPFVDLLTLPTIAAGSTGVVYVAWANLRRRGRSSVEIARSGDGGASWQRPHPIARTATQPFGPRIAIARDGTIGATYYEAGRASGGTTWPASVFFAYSRDGARSWRHTRIAGSTNLLTAEHPGGGLLAVRIGDYFGLAASGSRFLAAYVLASPQAAVSPQNVFVTRIDFTDGAPARAAAVVANLRRRP